MIYILTINTILRIIKIGKHNIKTFELNILVYKMVVLSCRIILTSLIIHIMLHFIEFESLQD